MSAYQIKTNQSESVSIKQLATVVAALQRLNYRVKMLDPYARNAMFTAKLKVSELLCKSGFCTGREIQHRDFGESLCRMRFRLGAQSFIWATPTGKIRFDVLIKDPPAQYEGDPADEAKIAVMNDQELMATAVNYGNPPPIQPMPQPVSAQDIEEQQLTWIKAFHDENGRWPSASDTFPAGNALGEKAFQWRKGYKNGSLDWHIVKRLNGIGFPWDAQSAEWFERFFRAYEFLKANLRWPSYAGGTSEDEKDLAQWLWSQASNYRNGLLDSKKKWLLDRLNYDWGGYSRCQKRYSTVR